MILMNYEHLKIRHIYAYQQETMVHPCFEGLRIFYVVIISFINPAINIRSFSIQNSTCSEYIQCNHVSWLVTLQKCHCSAISCIFMAQIDVAWIDYGCPIIT